MIDAKFFDGQSARENTVRVEQRGRNIVIYREDGIETGWSIAGVHAIDPPEYGKPFRLTHDDFIGARLIIRDQKFVDQLIAENPSLNNQFGKSHFKQVAWWTVGGLAAVLLAGWVAVAFLPGYLAPLMPDKWRNAAGEQIERQVAGSSKVCESDAGKAAVSAIIARISEGDPNFPPIKVTVYDMDLVNAFAASGGRIVLTRGLIEAADSAEEVAGVVAHEVGHVAYYHSEQQMIRLSGMQVLISIATGTNGGDLVSNVAGIATILTYSRAAEREADLYARNTLTTAKIDPLAFRSFFEKLMKLEGKKVGEKKSEGSTLESLGNVFSTHPDTEKRIEEILPLPAGITPVQVATPEQWQALKAICKS